VRQVQSRQQVAPLALIERIVGVFPLLFSMSGCPLRATSFVTQCAKIRSNPCHTLRQAGHSSDQRTHG
jgi:hypothetical protein